MRRKGASAASDSLSTRNIVRRWTRRPLRPAGTSPALRWGGLAVPAETIGLYAANTSSNTSTSRA